MNPKWKLGVLFLLSALITLWPASAKLNGAAQMAEPDYKNNNCVSCIRVCSNRCAWANAL